jgi:hypothetical protein
MPLAPAYFSVPLGQGGREHGHRVANNAQEHPARASYAAVALRLGA